MTGRETTRDLTPGRWLAVAGLAALLLGIGAGAAATTAASWQRSLAEQDRLLPGVSVAGIDVGSATLADARELARREARAVLSRSVTVTHGDLEWPLTPRDVGATTTVEQRLEAAAAATSSTSLPQLAMIRWLGAAPERAIDVAVSVPPEGLLAFVDDLAAAVDRPAQDATAEWTAQGAQLRDPTAGQRLDRAAAAADILAALRGDTDRVALTVDAVAPSRGTDRVARVLPALERAVEEALDRTVTITHGDRRWRVTPRSLGATPDLQPAVTAALARHDEPVWSGQAVAAHATTVSRLPAAIPFEVPNDQLGELLDAIAGQVSRGARDASVDYSSGWVEVVPGRPGRTVDRHGAAVALREALAGGSGTVELPVRETRPATTDLGQVLLVRQHDRRVYLYEDGEIVRDWPVAVGQAGADTPTGVFTVGAKRAAPTWYNPSPDGWGAAMPRVVGPGPNNPLGLRAVNWMDGDRDTLIRFHGTANTGSIGAAASRGCVRLTNRDVVELFDLVEPGATIVSVRA